MTLSMCDEVESLIDRELQGWSDAERLRVEEHLQSCARCLENLTFLRVVRETIKSAPYALNEAARGRAIDKALSGKGRAAEPAVGGRRTVFAVAAALAVAAAVLLWMVREPAAAPLAHAPRAPAAARPDAPTPQWFVAKAAERRTFAHADVRLAAGTRLRFDAHDTTLEITEGQVEVDVDVSKGQPFRVLTSNFRVEVLGTMFTVTPDSVRVQHGHVQVFALDGSVLARDLGAGTSFSYGAPGEAAGEAAGKTAGETAGETAINAPTPRASQPDAQLLLARARDALSAGNTKSARALIERAEQTTHLRGELAEAATLRAEAALLDRDGAAAMRLYLSVAGRFADLPAGENASFAAAKLAGRSDLARERELLGRYLKRYPHGRFADESKLRLQQPAVR